jgi:hypothetical protein
MERYKIVKLSERKKMFIGTLPIYLSNNLLTVEKQFFLDNQKIKIKYKDSKILRFKKIFYMKFYEKYQYKIPHSLIIENEENIPQKLLIYCDKPQEVIDKYKIKNRDKIISDII